MVRWELLSNCVVGTTLATWFLYELQPKEGSTWEFLLLVGACFASGAAHGLVTFLVGLSLFGGDFGRCEFFLSRDQSFLTRTRRFLLVLVFETVASGLMWGAASSLATAFAYGQFVKTVVYFVGPEIPLWLVAVGPFAGLVAGMLSIAFLRWANRDTKERWIALNGLLLRHSNFYVLAQANAAHANHAKVFDPADLRG